MSDEVIVAIIGLVGVIVTVLVRQMVADSKEVAERLRKIEHMAHENSIKLETLWAIYAEDAIREAKKSDMIAHHSTAVPTQKWMEIVPIEIRDGIDDLIEKTPMGTCPREMAIEITNVYAEELLMLAAKSDISAVSMFGTIYMICVTSGKWNCDKN